MKIEVLQHVDFENEGSIADWARAKGHTISRTRLFAGEKLPEHSTYDLLVVMGGPMNIYEEKEFPYLIEEKRFLKDSIAQGKKVLGICLGAQLLADVLGGKVTRNIEKEIGWHKVEMTEEGLNEPVFKNVPKRLTAFHWHGDTFAIPKGAVHAAVSEACAGQAFVYKKKVVGLQYHIETNLEGLSNLINNCYGEIMERPFIQTADKMLAGVDNLKTIRTALFTVLDNLSAL